MTVHTPICELAEVNPRLPADLAAETERIVNFVPMSCLSESGYVAPDGDRSLGEVKKGFTFFVNGDVIVAKITPCMENGKAAYVENLTHGIGFGSTEFHVLRPGPRLHGRYLFYMIWNAHFRRVAASRMQGAAGQKRVPTPFIETFQIPFPFPDDSTRSLIEQKRIAATLDKADAVRRKRRHVVNQIVTLRQAALAEILSSPGLKESRVEAIADVGGGLALSGRRDAMLLKLPYLRVANVHRDRLDLTEVKTLGVEPQEAVKARLRQGDVLIVEGHGNPEELGRSAVWDGSIPECLHQNHLIRVRCDENTCLPEYLSAFINSPFGRRQMLRSGKTTSGLNTISISNVRGTIVKLPPIEVQRHFVETVNQQFQLQQLLETNSRNADALFDSLSDRAFKGEL